MCLQQQASQQRVEKVRLSRLKAKQHKTKTAKIANMRVCFSLQHVLFCKNKNLLEIFNQNSGWRFHSLCLVYVYFDCVFFFNSSDSSTVGVGVELSWVHLANIFLRVFYLIFCLFGFVSLFAFMSMLHVYFVRGVVVMIGQYLWHDNNFVIHQVIPKQQWANAWTLCLKSSFTHILTLKHLIKYKG